MSSTGTISASTRAPIHWITTAPASAPANTAAMTGLFGPMRNSPARR